MILPFALTAGLLQATALQAPVVFVSQRDWFDWLSGGLQVVVLLLGAGMLVALILLLLSIRAEVHRLNKAVERFTATTTPLINRTTGILDDVHEVVAMVRTDVERVSHAAGAVTEQLLDAADSTSQRIGQVNAVLDVLQGELESTAIGTVSAIRGVRVGARALTDNLSRRELASRFGPPDRDDRDGPAMATRSSEDGQYPAEEDDAFLDDADFDFDDEARPA